MGKSAENFGWTDGGSRGGMDKNRGGADEKSVGCTGGL